MRYSDNSTIHCHVMLPLTPASNSEATRKRHRVKTPQNYGLPSPSLIINAEKLSSCGYEAKP